MEKRSIVLLHGVVSSQLTWWRPSWIWRTSGGGDAVDMLGHGSRHAAGPDELTIDDLAQDVLAQIPGPVNVLAGHSLGSIVAMTLVGLEPDYCDRVVVEDPPALAGRLILATSPTAWRSLCGLLARIPPGPSGRYWRRTRCGRAGCGEFGQEPADARRRSGCLTTEDRSVGPSGTGPGLPGTGVAARRDRRLGAHRSRSVVLMNRLPPDHIAVLESGHTIHRERPALWLHHVLRFAEPP